MNDNNLVSIVQSLDLDFSPAIFSVKHFEKSIESLNKQLAGMKGIALQSAKDINTVFASQLGQVAGNKTLVDQFGKPFRTIESEAKNANNSISAIANSYNATTSAARQHGNAVKEVGKEYSILSSEFNRRAQWFLTGTLFYGVINGAKEAASTIRQVEVGITDISRVMNDSTFVFDEYRDKLLQLGIDYGQTFDTVQDISMRWAQAGYNVADSLELTETALMALNAAELNAQTATQGLIAIMSQWGIEANELVNVIDKINVTSDNFAVTSQDLVDGLVRSSGAARNMNLSLEQTVALLTVMREASGRTGREVGNALNSILSYMQRTTAINTFERLGVQVFLDEARTQFRNVMDIMSDLSANWDRASDEIKDGFIAAAEEAGLFGEEMAAALDMQEQWNDLQRRDVSQAAAGVFRRNYFIALIDNFAKSQEVLNNMMDAAGYTMEKNAIAMETLDKKTQSLKAATEQLAVAVGDAGLTDALKLLVDAGTGAIKLFNSMPDEIQKPILAFGTMFLTLKTGQQALRVFGFANAAVTKSMDDLTKATIATTVATNTAATASKSFAMNANQWIILISLAGAAISAIYNWNKKNNEEMKRSLDVLRQQKEISNSINSLIPQYEELASKTNLTVDEQSKLLDIKQKITNLLPNTKQALDNENLSLSTQLEIIKELNQEELERAKQTARKNIEKYEDKYDNSLKEMEAASKALEKLTTRYDELYQRRDDLNQAEKNEFNALPLRIEAQTERLEHHKNIVNVVEESIKLYNEALENQNTVLDSNIDSIEKATNLNQKHNKSLEDSTKNFEKATSKLQAYQSILNEINSKQGLSSRTLLEIVARHQELLPYLSDEKELRKQLIDIISKEEETQRIAYANMLMYNKEFFDSKIKGNHDLIKKLEEYYKIDLENAKSLAHAKEMVENELIRNLSGKWAEYYGALTTGHNQVLENNLVRAAMSGSSEANDILIAVKAYKDAQSRFENLALDFSGIDFKGINSSNVKNPTFSSRNTENKQLSEALKLLDHRKRISVETQDSIKREIEELNRINSLYVKTEDERMNMAERIYAAEKRLMDKRLQDSVNWINEKKSLDELSTEREIYLWEKVMRTQSNNIEAVKQATLNLHKLRQQLNQETTQREENSIQHLTKLGVYSIQQQIDKYRELYSFKASSIDEEMKQTEQLFGLYKNLLGEQQKTIKDAYDERLRQIEAEASRRKSAQEDVIRGIETELKLLDRQEQAYDHDQKMASLREELAYWQVRTSEEARKKVAELTEQIAEEERKREVELKKQTLEDKKQVAQDEIKAIDDAAKKERENWEKSYNLVMKAFDEHSTNIVARAAVMSKEAYQEWERNYLIPLQTALSSADFDSFNSIGSGFDSFFNDFSSSWDNFGKDWDVPSTTVHDWGMSEADYQRFKDNGRRWAELEAQGYKQATNAEMQRLNAENDALRIKYGRDPALGEKPKFHQGAKTLSYGIAEFMPGEYVFPPDLSKKMDGLLEFLKSNPAYQSNSSSTSYTTDNRREVKINNLLNIERNYLEDDVDANSLARELQRVMTSIK